MLAHLKEKNEFKFTSELIMSYQNKIDEIIQNVFSRKDNLEISANMKGTSVKDRVETSLMKASTSSERS